MKKGLFRPENCLLPIALAAGVLLGSEIPVIRFFCFWLLISLLSLCADGAFCLDAARQTSLRQVDRRFFGSIVQVLIGTAVAAALMPLLKRPLEGRVWIIVAAGVTIIEQLFVERLRAHDRATDAVVLAIMNALLLTVGFAFDSLFPAPGMGVAAGAGLGLIVALLTLTIVPPQGFSAVPACYARGPKALLQNLLYPAVLIGVGYAANMLPTILEIMAGMIVWRGARTVCRRSPAESAPLNFWLMLICAGLTAAALFVPGIMWFAACVDLAMLCAIVVFAHISWRNAVGAALLIAAFAVMSVGGLPQNAVYIIGCVSAAAAVVINVRHAFLRSAR